MLGPLNRFLGQEEAISSYFPSMASPYLRQKTVQ